jgi:hypothetical protein
MHTILRGFGERSKWSEGMEIADFLFFSTYHDRNIREPKGTTWA